MSEPLDAGSLVTAVAQTQAARAGGCGAVATFAGLARGQNLGRRVHYLDYEAYAPLALTVFAQIRDEIAAEWPGAVVGMHTFGASAPLKELQTKFGFTAASVAHVARETLVAIRGES